MDRHPKQSIEEAYKDVKSHTFASEADMNSCAEKRLKETHTDPGYGGGAITRDDSDNPVENAKPFKNLTGGK